MPDFSTSPSPSVPDASAAQRAEEGVLFGRFLAGDDDAFLRIFHQHDRSLRLYCRRVLGNHAAAEDIVQETWERVIAMRGEERPVERPAGLFYRIARNRCIDHLRRERRSISIDEMPPETEWSHEHGGENEMYDAVIEGLEALPFEAREVLVLHHYCGYRFDEIAAMLERTPEAIWARASRARKHLRSIVSAILQEQSSILSTSDTQRRHSTEKNHAANS